MNHLVWTLMLKLIYLVMQHISYFDNSRFAPKSYVASLKTAVDNSDIDKFVPVPVDFKLSHVVKCDVVKKSLYDKLVAKVNSIDTSGFV